MSGGDGGFGLEEEHEEHVNHEAWVIPYADMLTLLMALFIMLFAISTVDLAKFEKLADSLGRSLGQGGSDQLLDGGPSVLDGAGPAMAAPDTPTREQRAEEALQREEHAARAAAAEARSLDDVEARIRQQATAAGVSDLIGLRREDRGLIVTIVADQVMFDPGQASVRPEGTNLLRQVMASLQGLPNRLSVEGHTDDVPIRTAQFRSNWELSTARATEVLRFLTDQLGVPVSRVSASGYGDQRPLASNGDAAGRARNRRVELAVLSETAPTTP